MTIGTLKYLLRVCRYYNIIIGIHKLPYTDNIINMTYTLNEILCMRYNNKRTERVHKTTTTDRLHFVNHIINIELTFFTVIDIMKDKFITLFIHGRSNNHYQCTLFLYRY